MGLDQMMCRTTVLVALLSCCAPVTDTDRSRENASAVEGQSGSPPMVPGAARSDIDDPNGPIADGEADMTGLTAEQIDVMFAAAFEQAAPFEAHSAVCLAVTTEASGWRRDPPETALQSFRELTTLPVLPASKCAFDVFPYVIENRDRAMLYTVVIEPRGRSGSINFWAHATYGNLGANGAKFTLRRGLSGWSADFAGVRSIS